MLVFQDVGSEPSAFIDDPLLTYFDSIEHKDLSEIFQATESNDSFSNFVSWPVHEASSTTFGDDTLSVAGLESEDEADFEIVESPSLLLEDYALDHAHSTLDDLVAASTEPEDAVMVVAVGTPLPLPLSAEPCSIILSPDQRQAILTEVRSACVHSEAGVSCQLREMGDNQLVALKQSFVEMEREEKHQAVQFLLLAGMKDAETADVRCLCCELSMVELIDSVLPLGSRSVLDRDCLSDIE